MFQPCRRQMERGVERRYDLIQELRGTHALQNTAMEEKDRDHRRVLCMQHMRDVAGKQVSHDGNRKKYMIQPNNMINE